jgi:nicotinamidase/pyrazinamidase
MVDSTPLGPDDALLIVDVQIDFCPGGALPIPDGDRVVPVINRWIELARAAGAAVFASRDWHPREHLSFIGFGGQWPPHCIQDSDGARFHPDLNLPAATIVVTKGVRFDRDQYSAFNETGLATELRRRGVTRLWIGGLAQDVCVRATTLDALQEGFDVRLIADACRAVSNDSGATALREMQSAGARVTKTPDALPGNTASDTK